MRRALVGVLLFALVGCNRSAGPPAIELGSSCATCRMDVTDLRFACERETDKGWLVYDSIECLVRDDPGGRIALADYDTKTLHFADSVWLVHGSFPSPMGGGYAAFVSRATADSIAQETHGEVMRLADRLAQAERR